MVSFRGTAAFDHSRKSLERMSCRTQMRSTVASSAAHDGHFEHLDRHGHFGGRVWGGEPLVRADSGMPELHS